MSTARLRMVSCEKNEMYIQRISAINMKIPFRSLSEQAEETVLIDSGATENFLDKSTWERMGIGNHETVKPIMVYNVDGMENSQGKITHYCWLWVFYTGKQKLQRFYIASLGKESIILGYPFLYIFNPTIDWQQGRLPEELHIQTTQYKYRFRDVLDIQRRAIKQMGLLKKGEAIYMRWSIAQEWACEAAKKQAHLTEKMIPEEYRRHARVFSETESLRFSPKQEEDMTIPLKEGSPDVINCKIYLLTWEERGLLEKFQAKELKLGRIKEGPSPYTSPMYFINKKDSEEKCIIMDYREVNKWTVCNNNPLPNIREALENLRNKTLFSKFDIC